MKKILLIFLLLQFQMAICQVDCYSDMKYQYLNANKGNVNFKTEKGKIGLCISDNYFALDLFNTVKIFPIAPETYQKSTNKDGYMTIEFFSDIVGIYQRAYWHIRIIYKSTREVYLTNTIYGDLYLMEFKDAKYLKVKTVAKDTLIKR